MRINLGNQNIFKHEDRDRWKTASCCPFYCDCAGCFQFEFELFKLAAGITFSFNL